MDIVNEISNLQPSTFFDIVYRDDFVMPYHAHRNYELMYVKSGNMTIRYQDPQRKTTAALPLTNHQFILIDSEVLHKVVIERGHTCHLMNLELSPRRLTPSYNPTIGEFLLSVPKLKDIGSIPSFFSQPFPVRVLVDTCSVEDVVRFIHTELNREHGEAEKRYVLGLLLPYLFLQISQCLPQRGLLLSGNRHIRQADNFMQAHFREDLSVDSIARAVGLNPSYLQRTVKRTSGKTLMSIVNEYRVEYSKQLLEETDYPVEDIARLAGFHSRQSFAENFKKLEGISPHGFRTGKQQDKLFRHYGIYMKQEINDL